MIKRLPMNVIEAVGEQVFSRGFPSTPQRTLVSAGFNLGVIACGLSKWFWLLNQTPAAFQVGESGSVYRKEEEAREHVEGWREQKIDCSDYRPLFPFTTGMGSDPGQPRLVDTDLSSVEMRVLSVFVSPDRGRAIDPEKEKLANYIRERYGLVARTDGGNHEEETHS